MAFFNRNKPKTINVFLVHPKNMKEHTVKQYAVRCSKLVNLVLMEKGDRRVCVTTPASTDYFIYGKEGVSDWNHWYSSVMERYGVFVLVSPVLGKASADLVKAALLLNKPIRLLTSSGFIQVHNIIEVNKDDWQQGWLVNT